jgi:type VI secretion system protein VasG
MEKAHPGVQDVFFQVFDKGTMKDGEGRDIDFRNTVIIMTSNTGTDVIARLFADPETAPDAEGLALLLREEMGKAFRPAFLSRVTVVPYLPLGQDTLRRIVSLQIERIAHRVAQSFGATTEFSADLIQSVVSRCTDASAGARGIESMLARTLLPDLSAQFLSRMAEGKPVEHVSVTVDALGKFNSKLT